MILDQHGNPFPPPAPPSRKKTAGSGLRAMLRQGSPGGWSSDHREEANHYTGWNYVAIRAIAMQAARAEVSVYHDGPSQSKLRTKTLRRRRRDQLGSTAKALVGRQTSEQPLPDDHPLMQILHRPSPTQSGSSLRYELIQQLSLTGMALIWKVRNLANTRTVQRFVIPTAAATPVQPQPGMPRGGWRIQPISKHPSLFFDDDYAQGDGWTRAVGSIIPSELMQVIRWPHPVFKDDGASPLSAGALWIDSSEQIDQSRWNHLARGIDPTLFFSVPDDWDGDEDELEALQRQLDAKYGGAHNAGKVFVVKGVATPVTTNPKDMAYQDAFVQLRDASLALHGVPPIAAGITEAGAYAAFYAALKQFVELTVQPTLDFIADEDTEQLAYEFGDGLTIEYEAKSVDDPELLETQLQTDIQAGARTMKEYREVRGLPAFGDERDDQMIGGAQPAQESQLAGIGDPNQGGNILNAQLQQKQGAKQPGKPESSQGRDETSTGIGGAPKRPMGNPAKSLRGAKVLGLPDSAARDMLRAFVATIPDGDLCECCQEPRPREHALTILDDLPGATVQSVAKSLGAKNFPLGLSTDDMGLVQTLRHDKLILRVKSDAVESLRGSLAEGHEESGGQESHIVLATLKPGRGRAYVGQRPFDDELRFDGLALESGGVRKSVTLTTAKGQSGMGTDARLDWFNQAANRVMSRYGMAAVSNGNGNGHANGRSKAHPCDPQRTDTDDRFGHDNDCWREGRGSAAVASRPPRHSGNGAASSGGSPTSQQGDAGASPNGAAANGAASNGAGHEKPQQNGGESGSQAGASKPDAESEQPERPRSQRDRYQSVIAELQQKAAEVKFSDEKFVEPSSGYNFDEDEVESSLDSSEQDELQSHIDGERDAAIDFDMEYFNADVNQDQADEAAGYGNRDVYDMAMEAINGLDIDEASKQSAQEAVDRWYADSNATGAEAFDGIAQELFGAGGEAAGATIGAIEALKDDAVESIADAYSDLETQAADSYREQLEYDFDDSDARRAWLRDFYDNNQERFSTSADSVTMDQWQAHGNGKEQVYHFRMDDGRVYQIYAMPTRAAIPGGNRLENAITVAFGQVDESDWTLDYKINNSGDPSEVIGKVVPAIAAMAKQSGADMMYFTAAGDEPSRQRLYDRLTKITATVAPEYFAVATGKTPTPKKVWDEANQRYVKEPIHYSQQNTRQYFVVNRNYQTEVEQTIAANPNLEVDVLVKTIRRAIRGRLKAQRAEASKPAVSGAAFATSSGIARSKGIVRPVRRKSTATKDECGANAPGGGGFQPGNDCAKGDGKGADKKPSKHAALTQKINEAKAALTHAQDQESQGWKEWEIIAESHGVGSDDAIAAQELRDRLMEQREEAEANYNHAVREWETQAAHDKLPERPSIITPIEGAAAIHKERASDWVGQEVALYRELESTRSKAWTLDNELKQASKSMNELGAKKIEVSRAMDKWEEARKAAAAKGDDRVAAQIAGMLDSYRDDYAKLLEDYEAAEKSYLRLTDEVPQMYAEARRLQVAHEHVAGMASLHSLLHRPDGAALGQLGENLVADSGNVALHKAFSAGLTEAGHDFNTAYVQAHGHVSASTDARGAVKGMVQDHIANDLEAVSDNGNDGIGSLAAYLALIRKNPDLDVGELTIGKLAEHYTINEDGRDYVKARQLHEAVAQEFLDSWARSSTDGNPTSAALQLAVDKRFGDTGDVSALEDRAKQVGQKLYDEHAELFDAFVDGTYRRTQDALQRAGVEKVTLFRGMELESYKSFPDAAGKLLADGQPVALPVHLDHNPLSSFSMSYGTAHEFGTGNEDLTATIMAVEVPRERIFSLATTGMGCLTEAEVLVTGEGSLDGVLAAQSQKGQRAEDLEDLHNFARVVRQSHEARE